MIQLLDIMNEAIGECEHRVEHTYVNVQVELGRQLNNTYHNTKADSMGKQIQVQLKQN